MNWWNENILQKSNWELLLRNLQIFITSPPPPNQRLKPSKGFVEVLNSWLNEQKMNEYSTKIWFKSKYVPSRCMSGKCVMKTLSLLDVNSFHEIWLWFNDYWENQYKNLNASYYNSKCFDPLIVLHHSKA